ncbi:MAG: hypothetical protein OEV58_16165 [Gammaproteobacteria bacterium]|nr:hypothetical protein [Gammaproteobacteria bacterium]MDH5261257.1 hypothetical protein [Gammaproteobacteria bacterium]
MNRKIFRLGRLVGLLILYAGLSACDDPQVYGSVGFSSYGGGYYGGGSRMGTSISIGGRIF